jgi:hypothetical protein
VDDRTLVLLQISMPLMATKGFQTGIFLHCLEIWQSSCEASEVG